MGPPLIVLRGDVWLGARGRPKRPPKAARGARAPAGGKAPVRRRSASRNTSSAPRARRLAPRLPKQAHGQAAPGEAARAGRRKGAAQRRPPGYREARAGQADERERLSSVRSGAIENPFRVGGARRDGKLISAQSTRRAASAGLTLWRAWSR